MPACPPSPPPSVHGVIVRLKAGLSSSGMVGTQGSLSVAGTNAASSGGGGSGTGSGAAGDGEGGPEEKASSL